MVGPTVESLEEEGRGISNWRGYADGQLSENCAMPTDNCAMPMDNTHNYQKTIRM